MEKPAQCAYEDCEGGSIWYHGWYERKEGNIPCGECGASDRLSIRRFICCGCGRTFSRRPSFLVFGHPLAALAYQLVLEDIAASVPDLDALEPVQPPVAPVAQLRGNDWWQPGVGAIFALVRRLRQAASGLIARLEKHLGEPPSGNTDIRHLVGLGDKVAQVQSTEASPRLSCHVLFIGIAWTRARACYRLTGS